MGHVGKIMPFRQALLWGTLALAAGCGGSIGTVPGVDSPSVDARSRDPSPSRDAAPSDTPGGHVHHPPGQGRHPVPPGFPDALPPVAFKDGGAAPGCQLGYSAPDNPPASLQDRVPARLAHKDFDAATYLVPRLGAEDPERGAIVVRGQVAIQVRAHLVNREGTPTLPARFRMQYLLDGEPLGPPLAGSFSYTWSTTGTSEGAHALGIRMLDGDGLDLYQTYPIMVIVDNTPGPVTAAHRLPILGQRILSAISSPAVDFIQYPGFHVHPPSHPYPYKRSPPAHTLADPGLLRRVDQWFVEPLTQPVTKLYQGIPSLYVTREGHLFSWPLLTQAGQTSERALDDMLRTESYGGPREHNFVTPYSTFVPDPAGPGWFGVGLEGLVFRIKPHGDVVTLAGKETTLHSLQTYPPNKNVFPYVPVDVRIPLADLEVHQKEAVGNFEGQVYFKGPNDLAVDPRNPKVLYVADTENHRIAKVDLTGPKAAVTTYAGQPGVAGYLEGPRTQARFNKPYSLVAAADGTLYVADRMNNAIRSISPAGMVSTLVGKGPGNPPVPPDRIKLDAGEILISNPDPYLVQTSFADATINFPFVVRMDSRGNIVLGENATSAIRRIDLARRQVTTIARIPKEKETWIWLDVDRWGNVGPRDDILIRWFDSNDMLVRISADGTKQEQITGGYGNLRDGPFSLVGDPAGHYAWAVAIDDEEARFLLTGFGQMGISSVRRVAPDDPVDYDHALFGRGRDIYETGTVQRFPFGSRPSLSAVHGPTGFGRLMSVPRFDDLVGLTDAALGDYIRKGAGGSVARPEITGEDLRALIYFIRRNSLLSHCVEIARGAAPADQTAPEIGDVKAMRTADGSIEIAWQTDQPALGLVRYGRSAEFGLFTDIETSYGQDHKVVIRGLERGQMVFFGIHAKDEAGNQGWTEGSL